MPGVYPIRLEAKLHETIWGGQRLAREGWKQLPTSNIAIGESWETEISTIAQNEPYTGKTLGLLVEELGPDLLGEQSIAIYGRRFPLLAKFIDANADLSVQVHPDDLYAAQHEGGKLGKTECWYILSAEPSATIVHGFKSSTSRSQVQRAIETETLDDLLHKEHVSAGDAIFLPAGTVHAIGSGIMLYEVQEYSDITYRIYDYGRLTPTGTPRALHIARSLDVSHYDVSRRVKAEPVALAQGPGYAERCLVACQYFVTREIIFTQLNSYYGYKKEETRDSCIILTSLSTEIQLRYGVAYEYSEHLSRGETMVLPATLGSYCIEGAGAVLLSYVPSAGDEAWQLWEAKNR